MEWLRDGIAVVRIKSVPSGTGGGMKATQQVIDQYERYVMNTYVRQPLVITKGKGSRVWDVEGQEYLDLFPG
ncbi:MAG: hypothetical protein HY598_00285, partial [Candidatus Omnitrophica bacterium]|nr:hypothetical protein [Candidatus Omnitrophota bacterium]